MSASQLVFIVQGCSMQPVLRSGDRLLLSPVEKEILQKGDILVFNRADGRKIVHRVIRTNPLQTRGDNCANDDAPVPENSPLFKAEYFIRDGIQKTLTGGASGCKEFQKNQRNRKIKCTVKKVLAPFFLLNPFKIPFSRLTHTEFRGYTMYYAGRRPVGWHDEDGWHWMRFARFFVRRPAEKDLNGR